MEQSNNIWHVTFLLTIIAGFCDTVTFVAADNIFSAHVTGNFIVFAYQIVKGYELHAWVKLLSFPVFIVSVIVGGWLATKTIYKYKLLYWEGIILVISGVTAYFLNIFPIFASWSVYPVAMLVVFAMGLQNTFGKLYSKETYGPTTVMTGNVTQASLDIGNLMKTNFKNTVVALSFKKQLVTIMGFLLGCYLGAVTGKNWGLTTVMIPGIAMIFCYIKNRNIRVET